MVHALEQIQRLLKPDGCLIDIHPIREAPFIKVYRGSDLLFAESDPGYDYDEDLRHADEALDEILQRGSFLAEGTLEFELITPASSLVIEKATQKLPAGACHPDVFINTGQTTASRRPAHAGRLSRTRAVIPPSA